MENIPEPIKNEYKNGVYSLNQESLIVENYLISDEERLFIKNNKLSIKDLLNRDYSDNLTLTFDNMFRRWNMLLNNEYYYTSDRVIELNLV